MLSTYVSSGSALLSTAASGPDPILIDSFRFMHPDQKEAYTCWCTKTDSRKLNYGQRIDYIFVSLSLKESVKESLVLQEEHGSDHCPVMCQLALTLTPSGTIPSLSSHHFPEFTGKQSKLSTYFSKVQSSERLVKRKSSEPCISKKKLKSDGQTTMMSLWNRKQEDVSPAVGTMNGTDSPVVPTSPLSCVGSKLSVEWKDVFKAPPKAPPCSGHNEPAVLRTVKKNGPNKNRKFYVCARPDGAKSDPQSRCNFFQWTK